MKKKEYQKEYMGKIFIDKWFQLLCYYHYQTEMYDRALTDLRSPYDVTEAYMVDPYLRNLSYANARKTRKTINSIAQIEHIQKNENKHNEFSAQGWSDQYLILYSNRQLDWFKDYIKGEML